MPKCIAAFENKDCNSNRINLFNSSEELLFHLVLSIGLFNRMIQYPLGNSRMKKENCILHCLLIKVRVTARFANRFGIISPSLDSSDKNLSTKTHSC